MANRPPKIRLPYQEKRAAMAGTRHTDPLWGVPRDALPRCMLQSRVEFGGQPDKRKAITERRFEVPLPKHRRRTNARNSVSTKLTMAVGSCLKAWSRPQWVDAVLKQPF